MVNNGEFLDASREFLDASREFLDASRDFLDASDDIGALQQRRWPGWSDRHPSFHEYLNAKSVNCVVLATWRPAAAERGGQQRPSFWTPVAMTEPRTGIKLTTIVRQGEEGAELSKSN